MVFYIMARYDDAVCYDKVRWCSMLWQGTVVLYVMARFGGALYVMARYGGALCYGKVR